MFFTNTKRNRTLITMSAGMSMEAWNRAGIIHRELSYYKELSKYIGPLSFISYGHHHHVETHLLKQNISDADIIWTSGATFRDMPGGFFLASFVPPLYCKLFTDIKTVRTNQISGAWTGAAIANKLNVPFILRAGYLLSKNIRLDLKASIFKKKLLIFFEKWVVKHADAIIVTYSKAKKYFVREYNAPPSKISVIGNPINIELFRPQQQQNRTRRHVLFIGRFTPEKNIATLLLACHQAKSSITLLGSGPLKAEMIKLAESLNLDAQFIDYMPNTQIPQLMSEHILFIIPSHYEGNPKVLLEAMSCEMPCIASNIPEHLDVIKNEQEGLVVPATPESLANAIHQIFQYPSFSKTLGTRARAKIKQDYSLTGNALRESQLHEQILIKRQKFNKGRP
jgi:glycosyltransferase involved in cell wall biosynthesis